jgi:hypothetical protein
MKLIEPSRWGVAHDVGNVLPRNGRLLAMGGGREAMANVAHGVAVRKNREAPVCQKKVKKREVMWNFGESPPTVVMIVHTGLYVLWLRYGEKS